MTADRPATPHGTSLNDPASPGFVVGVLAVIGVVLFVLFYAMPMIVDKAGSPCLAVVERVMRNTAQAPRATTPAEQFGNQIGERLARAVSPFIVQQMVAVKYPYLPTSVGCAVAWWRALPPPRS